MDNNLKISLTALCDRGYVREVNEDSCLICQTQLPREGVSLPVTAYRPLEPDGTFLVVADGMGGAAAGDVASQMTVSLIAQQLPSLQGEECAQDWVGSVRDTIARIDTILKQHPIDHPETTGMGTTLVLAWIHGDKAHIAWCGDSRCYLFRPGEGLRQVTNDHSYVQELIDKGQLSPDEALSHPESNVITRCLGDTDIPSQADTTTIDLQPNDLLLLCSDGLCGYCTDDEISRIVRSHYTDIGAMCQALFDAALATGGYDNITIALASLISADAQKPTLPRSSLFGRMKQMVSHCFHTLFCCP